MLFIAGPTLWRLQQCWRLTSIAMWQLVYSPQMGSVNLLVFTLNPGRRGPTSLGTEGASQGLLYLKIFYYILSHLSMYEHICMHTCHCTSVEVREQLARVGFLLPLCGAWGSESAYKAQQQVPLPTDPSHWPSATILNYLLIVQHFEPVLQHWSAFLLRPQKIKR